MFRHFATGLFCLQGTMFLLTSISALMDYKSAIEGAMVDVEEFEAITSSSNTGAYCLVTRVEHAMMLLLGVLLWSIGWYVPHESKGVPALMTAFAKFVLAQSEQAISSNQLPVQVYQGDFTNLVGMLSYFNAGFALLYLSIAVGCFLGYGSADKEKKR